MTIIYDIVLTIHDVDVMSHLVKYLEILDRMYTISILYTTSYPMLMSHIVYFVVFHANVVVYHAIDDKDMLYFFMKNLFDQTG